MKSCSTVIDDGGWITSSTATLAATLLLPALGQLGKYLRCLTHAATSCAAGRFTVIPPTTCFHNCASAIDPARNGTPVCVLNH